MQLKKKKKLSLNIDNIVNGMKLAVFNSTKQLFYFQKINRIRMVCRWEIRFAVNQNFFGTKR